MSVDINNVQRTHNDFQVLQSSPEALVRESAKTPSLDCRKLLKLDNAC